jgi:hypothetical protein
MALGRAMVTVSKSGESVTPAAFAGMVKTVAFVA